MRIPYYVDHRVGLRTWVKSLARQPFVSLQSIGIDEVVSDVNIAFVVGCGHSGTTLLSSRLASLSQDVFLIRSETYAYMPYLSLKKIRPLAVSRLNEASGQGCKLLLEKTPKHVHCHQRIRRLHSSAKFIGIVRNPLDTVASLYKRFGILRYSCERYVIDNLALWHLSQECFCYMVTYEDLTERPRDTLASCLSWLGVTADMSMLDNPKSSYLIKPESTPHQVTRYTQIAEPIRPNAGGYKEILDTSQIKEAMHITRHVSRLFGYTMPSLSD